MVEGEKRLVEWPRFSIPFDHKLLHHSHNVLARLWIFGTLNLQNDWTSPFEHNSQSAVFFSKNIFHELNRIYSSCVMSVILRVLPEGSKSLFKGLCGTLAHCEKTTHLWYHFHWTIQATSWWSFQISPQQCDLKQYLQTAFLVMKWTLLNGN